MTQCARALWTLAGPTAAVAVVRKPRPTVNICSPDTRPSPKTTVACTSALARVGYGACIREEGKCRVPAPMTVGLQPRPT